LQSTGSAIGPVITIILSSLTALSIGPSVRPLCTVTQDTSRTQVFLSAVSMADCPKSCRSSRPRVSFFSTHY